MEYEVGASDKSMSVMILSNDKPYDRQARDRFSHWSTKEIEIPNSSMITEKNVVDATQPPEEIKVAYLIDQKADSVALIC